MKKNIGGNDKIIRYVIALAIILLIYFDQIKSPTLLIILLVVALVLIITGLFNFCPLYAILGKNTCKKQK